MSKSNVFWQAYLNLENELIEVSKYIFFTEKQLDTFSPYIAELLVQCCVQIESIVKELYFDIEGDQRRGDTSLQFDTDCLKSIDIKWETHNKTVMVVAPFFNFTQKENKELKPLKKAHKKGGTYWERNYQAVKHDRYNSLHLGNVKALLHALAALYLLNLYLRNDSWKVKFSDVSKIDYSLGSKIFAVKQPIVNDDWYGNRPILSESPYIIQYQKSHYQKMEELQQESDEKITKFLHAQPEWHEADFQSKLDKNENNAFLIFIKLTQYRLDKKIPASLPFSEKKERLINSAEWKSQAWQQNKHIHSKIITEENIQNKMHELVYCIAGNLLLKNQGYKFIDFMFNKAFYDIKIP